MDPEIKATLRSDTLTPILNLWRENVRYNVAPENEPYTEDMTLLAQLQGNLCASQVSATIYTEELTGLIERLTAFSNLEISLFYWETLDRRIHLRVSIDREKVNSNVTCDIRLRDGYDIEEEHHCVLATNLPWIDTFLLEVRRLVA